MNRIENGARPVTGRIHSIETCGAVDGPGLRCVVFLQGCPLRCQYCQNPDTWRFGDGREVDARKLYREIRKYRSYFRFSGGGITLSGGEPLMQPEFAAAILRLCKKEGIHTAIDTSGYASIEASEEAVALADLVILDLKCLDPAVHSELTGVDLDTVLRFARWLSRMKKRTWIRHVLVPSMTDRDDLIDGLIRFIAALENIEAVEILPFHNMARFKWESLGYPYRFRDCVSPTAERVREVADRIARAGINIPPSHGTASHIVA